MSSHACRTRQAHLLGACAHWLLCANQWSLGPCAVHWPARLISGEVCATHVAVHAAWLLLWRAEQHQQPSAAGPFQQRSWHLLFAAGLQGALPACASLHVGHPGRLHRPQVELAGVATACLGSCSSTAGEFGRPCRASVTVTEADHNEHRQHVQKLRC